MKATLSSTAIRELLAAGDLISAESRGAARGFSRTVSEALSMIGQHPEIGALRQELADPPVRFWTLHRYHYLLVYDPSVSPPQVLRILHGARDLPDLLSNLRWD